MNIALVMEWSTSAKNETVNEVLTKAADLLEKIEHDGLFATLERGTFADIKRMRDGGKGLGGVVLRAESYYNPFLTLLEGGAQ